MEAITRFHQLYYDSAFSAFSSGTWMNTTWMGIPVLKCPLDMWIYQELIFKIKPNTIIETGSYVNGSALFMANILDVIKQGSIITIDVINHADSPHPRITKLIGSSTSEEVFVEVKKKLKPPIMVILDSDHRKEHVYKELEMYSQLVTVDSYLIVEDTNLNGNPITPEFGPGPKEALDEFLAKNTNFIRDRGCEKFLLTFNPGGFLRRVQ